MLSGFMGYIKAVHVKTWDLDGRVCVCVCIYIYMYVCFPPLMYPRFVLELSGIVVVSLQIFPISTILGHM